MMSEEINAQNISEVKNRKSQNPRKKSKKAKESPGIHCTNQTELSDSFCEKLTLNSGSVTTNGTADHTEEACSLLKLDNESNRNSPLNTNTVEIENNHVYIDLSNVPCDLSKKGGESIHSQTGATNSSVENDEVHKALENLECTLNSSVSRTNDVIEFVSYESELQMPEIMQLIQKDLSEPYSIYTYRYFIHNWPKLCFLAMHECKCIGAIVCKLDLHRKVIKRGYIAMLAVDEKYRNKRIGSRLVRQAIQVMIDDEADEVVLETEITNKPALRLYENLGFVKDKRLFRYYLNGVDALRLKLWLR